MISWSCVPAQHQYSNTIILTQEFSRKSHHKNIMRGYCHGVNLFFTEEQVKSSNPNTRAQFRQTSFGQQWITEKQAVVSFCVPAFQWRLARVAWCGRDAKFWAVLCRTSLRCSVWFVCLVWFFFLPSSYSCFFPSLPSKKLWTQVELHISKSAEDINTKIYTMWP